jgi:predicted metal-dependent peptidase
MTRRRNHQNSRDIALEQYQEGAALVAAHPMFAPLWSHCRVLRSESKGVPDDGWAVVSANGVIQVHPRRRAEPQEWLYVLAHCLLHLGFGHFKEKPRPREWNAACDCFVAKFLADLKLGRPPRELMWAAPFAARDEERLYQQFCQDGIPEGLQGLGTAGMHHPDMIIEPLESDWWGHKMDWPACFGQGLSAAVTSAVKVAAGVETHLGARTETLTPARKARNWFISSYPLLGALAAAFDIIEDPLLCQRLSISVAAVDMESREIFLNPAAGLDEYECRFVMAHEMLHVGLRHDVRCQGRDPYLWNVACDYVINGWLREMGLGEMPAVGGLYDPELKGLSAEAIYDRIVTDLRRYRKLCTMRGIGLSDILQRSDNWSARSDGVALDEWYRQCLSQGLIYHEEGGRGLLPAGLIEEIRALDVPPIPWDVELARWFDDYFPPLERVRSYARLSRRQSATPDIPRPRLITPDGALAGRTFGVVLDTSGSMDRALLAKALGAIASYSLAREVPAARVVFCDAAAYDQGYMPPEQIAERVRVRGRGGTVLQPGIDLLEQAADFPAQWSPTHHYRWLL